ncbi:hypothetical protein EDB19DRAFT_387023 [Suillus lakei]|nr:hypothetical protein EDB19DRAFT_387023 [Suillus lakei]
MLVPSKAMLTVTLEVSSLHIPMCLARHPFQPLRFGCNDAPSCATIFCQDPYRMEGVAVGHLNFDKGVVENAQRGEMDAWETTVSSACIFCLRVEFSVFSDSEPLIEKKYFKSFVWARKCIDQRTDTMTHCRNGRY